LFWGRTVGQILLDEGGAIKCFAEEKKILQKHGNEREQIAWREIQEKMLHSSEEPGDMGGTDQNCLEKCYRLGPTGKLACPAGKQKTRRAYQNHQTPRFAVCREERPKNEEHSSTKEGGGMKEKVLKEP